MNWQKKTQALAGDLGDIQNASEKRVHYNTRSRARPSPRCRKSAPRSHTIKTGTNAPSCPPDFKRADNFNAFATAFGFNPTDWRTRVDFLNIEAKEIREGYE